MSDDESVCSFLKNPLSIGDLVGQGTRFEVNTNFDEGFINDIYDEVYGSDEDDGVEVDRNTLVSPWTKPFSELKEQMVAVNPYMHKKIVKSGEAQNGLMPEKSRVCIRYNAYWEGEGAPFDSSFLRGSSFNFYTGCGSVLEGLEAAVLTMHKGEEAQFIISYKVLFGEMGCPPRIRPRADGLFIIELVSFNAVGDVDAEQSVSAEDRKKYSVVVEKVKEIHLKGLDFFGQGMERNACRAFEKAVSILNFCHLENEEEEQEQTNFLIRLYTNLAVCYNKLNMARKTCMMCQEIRRLTHNNPSCKAIFQEGRALLMLGEYERSRNLLARAQRMEPQNEVISKELKDLENRYKSYQENQKSIWQKAMGIKKESRDVDDNETPSEFKQTMLEHLQAFKNSSIKDGSFKLPSGLTKQEIETVDELAKQFEMQLELSPITKSYSIRKK